MLNDVVIARWDVCIKQWQQSPITTLSPIYRPVSSLFLLLLNHPTLLQQYLVREDWGANPLINSNSWCALWYTYILAEEPDWFTWQIHARFFSLFIDYLLFQRYPIFTFQAEQAIYFLETFCHLMLFCFAEFSFFVSTWCFPRRYLLGLTEGMFDGM